MGELALSGAVEAVLFAVGEPLSAEKIAEAVGGSAEDVWRALDTIKAEYDARAAGICLLRMEERYQFATRPAYAEYVQRALDTRRNSPLSQAAMETLAIIAYNQPVSRSFIEQVRGVDSSSSVGSLLGKGLVEEAGRLDLPGRPVSFRTTDAFLRCFGMTSLAELPPTVEEPLEFLSEAEMLSSEFQSEQGGDSNLREGKA